MTSNELKSTSSATSNKLNNFSYGRKSQELLSLVNPDLRLLAYEVLKRSKYDIGITETYRSQARQEYLYSIGKSKTLNSYHCQLKALDFCVYNEDHKVTWDEKYYIYVGELFEQIAKEKRINITWGGRWNSIKDYCHVQIN